MTTNQLNLIMGAAINAKETREENDFYKTDPKALEVFLDVFDLHKNVWECACGDGGLSEVLLSRGYNVLSTDLVDRGYDKLLFTKDFFEFDAEYDGDILTNPPYKYASEFVLHALDLIPNGNYVVMFLKIQFLESQNRYDSLFKKYPPKYVYVLSNRYNTAKNGEFEKYKAAPALCYCWFVWEKGFEGEPTLRWIHK